MDMFLSHIQKYLMEKVKKKNKDKGKENKHIAVHMAENKETDNCFRCGEKSQSRKYS